MFYVIIQKFENCSSGDKKKTGPASLFLLDFVCDGFSMWWMLIVILIVCLAPAYLPPPPHPPLHLSTFTPSLPPPPPPLAGWSWTALRSSPSTRRATTGGGMVWRWALGPSWPAWSLLQTVERWWWGSLRRPSSLRLVRHPEEQRGLWFVFLKYCDKILLPSGEEIRWSSSAADFMLCSFIHETGFFEQSEHILNHIDFIFTWSSSGFVLSLELSSWWRVNACLLTQALCELGCRPEEAVMIGDVSHLGEFYGNIYFYFPVKIKSPKCI